jgi:hypothetical protein
MAAEVSSAAKNVKFAGEKPTPIRIADVLASRS